MSKAHKNNKVEPIEVSSKKTVDDNGTIIYRNCKGQFHRENGPTIESIDGFRSWYLNGERHRER